MHLTISFENTQSLEKPFLVGKEEISLQGVTFQLPANCLMDK